MKFGLKSNICFLYIYILCSKAERGLPRSMQCDEMLSHVLRGAN